jgi:2-polyprenyl-3-methyl-5-hydroxy-6-metoxy-1,4-benzoquinol methylase
LYREELYMICPICGDDGKPISRLSSNLSAIGYLKCNSCKSTFASRKASREELLDYYSRYYTESNLEPPILVKKSLGKTVRDFERYRSQCNTVCDLGFGAGTLLEVAQDAGWKCVGSEYSEDAIKIGKAKGWEVHHGDLGETDLCGPYDVLTIIETLEHVQNPRELLQQALVRIRAGGLLYGTTPNSGSLNAYLLKNNWSVITFPEHPVLLSRKSLKKILKELGFEQISVHSRGLNPYDLLVNIRIKMRIRETKSHSPGGRVDFGYSLNSAFSRNAVMNKIKFFVMFILAITNLGDSLVFKATKVKA